MGLFESIKFSIFKRDLNCLFRVWKLKIKYDNHFKYEPICKCIVVSCNIAIINWDLKILHLWPNPVFSNCIKGSWI